MFHRLHMAFRYYLYYWFGQLGLLGLTDRIRYTLHCRRTRDSNSAFVLEHPDYPLPPPDLAYDAYNHADWRFYRDSGRDQARVLIEWMAEFAPMREPLHVLEWGCGPGRVLRHLREHERNRELAIHGSDYNRASVDWCREHLQEITFKTNGAEPPLPFADASMDCIYAISVFTHLSESMQRAWAMDLLRVLKPHGIVIFTTHSLHFRDYLVQGERETFDHGNVVVRRFVKEGRKAFAAFHPASFVRDQLFKNRPVHTCTGKIPPVTASFRMSG